jgi:mono/diheme cytochrome c family protein
MRLRSSGSNTWTPCLAVLVLAAMTACGSGDLPLDDVDPDSVPAHPTYEQVFAILDRECVPCHQSGESGEEDSALAKFPGPALADDDAPDLNDCTSIVAQRDGIWDTIAANTMPPGAWPRLSSEERLTIRRWIDDGAPAPCNVVAPAVAP